MDSLKLGAVISILVSLTSFIITIVVAIMIHEIWKNSEILNNELKKQTRLLSEIAEKSGGV